jgi:hypothetical protein
MNFISAYICMFFMMRVDLLLYKNFKFELNVNFISSILQHIGVAKKVTF